MTQAPRLRGVAARTTSGSAAAQAARQPAPGDAASARKAARNGPVSASLLASPSAYMRVAALFMSTGNRRIVNRVAEFTLLSVQALRMGRRQAASAGIQPASRRAQPLLLGAARVRNPDTPLRQQIT